MIEPTKITRAEFEALRCKLHYSAVLGGEHGLMGASRRDEYISSDGRLVVHTYANGGESFELCGHVAFTKPGLSPTQNAWPELDSAFLRLDTLEPGAAQLTCEPIGIELMGSMPTGLTLGTRWVPQMAFVDVSGAVSINWLEVDRALSTGNYSPVALLLTAAREQGRKDASLATPPGDA